MHTVTALNKKKEKWRRKRELQEEKYLRKGEIKEIKASKDKKKGEKNWMVTSNN